MRTSQNLFYRTEFINHVPTYLIIRGEEKLRYFKMADTQSLLGFTESIIPSRNFVLMRPRHSVLKLCEFEGLSQELGSEWYERTDERVTQYSTCVFLNHSAHRALDYKHDRVKEKITYFQCLHSFIFQSSL